MNRSALLLGLLLLLTPADNLLALATPQLDDDVQATVNDEFLSGARQARDRGPSREHELPSFHRADTPRADGRSGSRCDDRRADASRTLRFLLDPLYVLMSLRC